MTSNASSSRMAMSIVALLVLAAGLWLLWPDTQDPALSNATTSSAVNAVSHDEGTLHDEKTQSGSQSTAIPNSAGAEDNQVAKTPLELEANQGREAMAKHESTQEAASKSDRDPSSQATSSQASRKQTASRDFRVSADDEFATVPPDRFFTTTGITDLSPEAEARTFRIGQRVYAYAAIHAPRKETVRITWYDSNNKEILPSAYLDVLVNTGLVGYRVFTYRIFRSPGSYLVSVSNSTNAVIGQVRFEVK